MPTIYARDKKTGKFVPVSQGSGAGTTDPTLSLQDVPADAKAVGDALAVKANKVAGTSGDFVVIGEDGNLTAKRIVLAEEVTF